jgi:hypothetical protein
MLATNAAATIAARKSFFMSFSLLRWSTGLAGAAAQSLRRS